MWVKVGKTNCRRQLKWVKQIVDVCIAQYTFGSHCLHENEEPQTKPIH